MMQKKVKFILTLVASAILTVFIYIVLHETGHMIVMLSAGAKITEFSIFGAHISGEGGNYTNASDLWLHANGALFPLLLSYIYLLFYKTDFQNSYYRILSVFFSMIPAFSMLSWLIIPFAFMNGNAPAGDDVTLFLYNFSQGHSPVIVSIVAALLIGISIGLIIKKKVLHNYIEVMKSARS